MGQCVICGKDSGKGVYCGSACKQKAYRNRNATVTKSEQSVTPESNCNASDDMFCEGVTWDDIDNLPVGVSRPTVRPDAAKANGPNWWNEPAYAYTIARLMIHTAVELEEMGVFVPCWVYERDKEAA